MKAARGPKVIVSGFTASGKSTIARQLATRLRIPVLAGSLVRAEFLGLSSRPQPRTFWLTDRGALRADLRRLDPLTSSDEVAFDQWHSAKYLEAPSGVFDAWFLAWLVPKDAPECRLWIDADLPTRARRAFGDGTDWPGVASAGALEEVVASKDNRCISYAQLQYGVRMESDRSPFDAIVHNPDSRAPEDALAEALEVVNTALSHL